MSAWNDTTSGVVNPDLMVKGTKGLRIVDAGILVSPLLHFDIRGRLEVISWLWALTICVDVSIWM